MEDRDGRISWKHIGQIIDLEYAVWLQTKRRLYFNKVEGENQPLGLSSDLYTTLASHTNINKNK